MLRRLRALWTVQILTGQAEDIQGLLEHLRAERTSFISAFYVDLKEASLYEDFALVHLSM